MSFAFRHLDLRFASGQVWLQALLSHVPDAHGLVVIASTSVIASRTSREFVAARTLHRLRYATLLVDLLSEVEEHRDPDARFDVPRLSTRLASAVDWARHQPGLETLPLALAASGTAAASMIKLAMQLDPHPFALVSRSGRLDLAGAQPLRQTRIPLLAIWGGSTDETLVPASPAFSLLDGPKEKKLIPEGGSLFLEPKAQALAAQASAEFLEKWRSHGKSAEPDKE